MATTNVQTVNTGADKAKLAAAALLVVGAFASFFLLSAQGALLQWLGFIVGLVLAAFVFLGSESG